MKLTIATAQFAVSADPARNADAIVDAIAGAAAAGARVVHFCEGALSGYAPHDLPSYAGYPWGRLRAAAERVAAAAGARRIWALVGSAHPLAAGDGAGPRPHNAIYVIDDRGALVDRYDKRFCAGDEVDGELALYSPGDHPVVVDIDGVRCGLMICHEYRYPELYRDYKARGVDLIFHSFHAAGLSEATYAAMEAEVGADHFADNWGRTLPAITMPAKKRPRSQAHGLTRGGFSTSSMPNSFFGFLAINHSFWTVRHALAREELGGPFLPCNCGEDGKR